MKKMITKSVAAVSALILVLSWTPSITSAAVCGDSVPPVTSAMESMNSYLNDNNEAGAKGVNGWLKTDMDKIHQTHSDAYLAEFGFTSYSGSSNTHYFNWASPSEPSKIFSFGTDGTLSEKSITDSLPSGIYRVPMRMRDLTKTMVSDAKLLSGLDSFFDACSYVDVSFQLKKNEAKTLMWYVTFTDPVKKTSYIVKVSAENKQNPSFMVFKNKVLTP